MGEWARVYAQITSGSAEKPLMKADKFRRPFKIHHFSGCWKGGVVSGRVLGPGVSRRKRSGMIVLRRTPISKTDMYSRHGGSEIHDPGMLLFPLICWTLDAAQVRLRYVARARHLTQPWNARPEQTDPKQPEPVPLGVVPPVIRVEKGSPLHFLRHVPGLKFRKPPNQKQVQVSEAGFTRFPFWVP